MRGTTIFQPTTCTHFFAIPLAFLTGLVAAQDAPTSQKKTVEPVFRVPKIAEREENSEGARVPNQQAVASPAFDTTRSNPVAPPVARIADARVSNSPEMNAVVDKQSISLVPKNLAKIETTSHPLDRAVELARSGLDHMQKNIQDYTAIMVKRERVDDVLSEPNYMRIKIRNPRTINNQSVPFSIYMKFLKPRGCAGREVIWVQGQNQDNLIAHESSPLLRFKNFHLDPDGFLAMKGNRYPIYDAGLENLALKLIEKAERDRAAGDCEVRYMEGAKINKRSCMVIEVKHPQQKAPYEFYLAKVYIDDELQIPIRFVSYDWPKGGSKPKILEEYTYVNVQLNVGLTDSDFSISNPAYNFAR